MSKKKLNCWESKKCRRVYGAEMDGSYGICPVYTEKRLDGVNDGRNAGRACWVVAGTMCNDKVQGSFAFKIKGCSSCEFYRLVKKEEGENIVDNQEILNKIKTE